MIKLFQKFAPRQGWARSRYIAIHDQDRCSSCGRYIKCCHFAAFYFADPGEPLEKSKGKVKPEVRLDAEKCWGCDLCANTCPSNAFLMKLLEA